MPIGPIQQTFFVAVVLRIKSCDERGVVPVRCTYRPCHESVTVEGRVCEVAAPAHVAVPS